MKDIVQSVDRTFSILEILSDYEEGLGITEIALKVDLHKSTVHRLLNTLIYKGYIQQDKNTSKYVCTFKLFELGSKKTSKLDVSTVARVDLEELMKKINEVVHLGVREDNDIVYILKVEPEKSIKMYTRIGMRKPMYGTAMGRSFMFDLKEEEIDEIWNSSNITKFTDKTITNLEDFKAYLNHAKTKGYVLDDQEIEEGIRCIGAPIRNYTGEICAALSISSSIFTFTDEKIEEYSSIILEYANKISQRLGYKI